jgi:acyl-coenzyme A thioesterase PaaI-like protein
MNIIEIPFNKFIEIRTDEKDECDLYLDFNDHLKNHLGTFHASAQFALAEACSGYCLQKQFSYLEGSAVPVLRKSEIKFKKPALLSIKAKGEILPDQIEQFKQQFKEKGRATILVMIKVTAQDGTVTMTGTYEWFVQRI